jgi:SdrD B-like domain
MKVMHAFFALLWLVTNSAVAARSDTHGVREKILDEDDNNPIVTRILQDSGTGSLGDFVWDDSNRNGIQDASEPGINGVLVTLRNASGNVLARTTTGIGPQGNAGFYQFTDLTPGDYQIEFAQPAGFQFSAPNQGQDDAVDSDADGGRTPTIPVGAGVIDHSWDAGLYTPCVGWLGGFVWFDMDADGIQDPGEPGIVGVTVNLYGAGLTLVSTTTTNASGNYLFSNLCGGVYNIQFILPGENYTFSPPNQGSNDTLDSDANPTDGKIQAIDLATDQSSSSLDAGMYASSLGDRVWNDRNGDGIQDSGESGIGGVTVNLYVVTPFNFVSATTTDANGYYGFFNLNPGSYQIEFILPANYW